MDNGILIYFFNQLNLNMVYECENSKPIDISKWWYIISTSWNFHVSMFHQVNLLSCNECSSHCDLQELLKIRPSLNYFMDLVVFPIGILEICLSSNYFPDLAVFSIGTLEILLSSNYFLDLVIFSIELRLIWTWKNFRHSHPKTAKSGK